ncbi:hypothetical protein N7494_012009 [Penicillium frequentans]|uniref:Rootletin n=1 Tax=Penicillium frequentans TaxID=3151616 RepID=A0AAD6CNF7_9EURO|nr:hypothetical protein N7494_012009 [Penicillium glabrum]
MVHAASEELRHRYEWIFLYQTDQSSTGLRFTKTAQAPSNQLYTSHQFAVFGASEPADPKSHRLEARIPGLRLTGSEDAECSPVVGPEREESSCVGIEDVCVQPKLRPDVPSQRITEFIDSRGGKVHQDYPGGDLEATENDPYQTSFESVRSRDERTDTVTQACPPFHDQVLQTHDYPSPKAPNEVRKGRHTRGQRSIVISKAEPQELNEDSLFRLLIGKIKQREESEAAATLMRHQMETQNTLLKDENEDLRQQVRVSQLRLQDSVEEAKTQRSLLSEWKTKIRNFKQVVNELGHGYDTLRDQADHHRETAMCLDNEKSDLTKAIDETKIRTSQAEGTIDMLQNKLAENDKAIALLEQSLSSSREGEENAKSQLSEQKKRVVTLESYIQNFALSHTKKLDVMKEGQKSIIENITTSLNAVTRNSTSHKDAVLLAIKDAFDDCRSSMLSLNTKLSEEQINVEEFTRKGQEVISRIGALSSQFTDNVEGGIKINNGVAKTLHKKFQAIEHHFGPSSPVMRRLSECDDSCVALKSKFEVVEPTLDALGLTAKALTLTEDTLVQGLAKFGQKLADAQLLASNPGLEVELASKFAENTQLQIKIHDLGSKLDNLQQTLQEKETLILDTQGALMEITEKQQKSECQNKQLETEKTDLRQQFEDTEQRIRQELSKKNAELMEKMITDHQAEILEFQKEKNEVEEVSGSLILQLNGIQNSLLVDEQGRDREALLQETEQQIQDLERSEAESKAQLEAQRTEIEKFQQLDATSRVENSDLRDQLEQAQQKIHDLEHQLTFSIEAEEMKAPRPTNIVPFAAIESQISGRPTTSQYGESCDFAMLFMSDEQSHPTPNKAIFPDHPLDNPENPGNDSESQQPDQYNKKPACISPEILNPSPNKKRKGVDFEPPEATKNGKQPMKVQPVASQPEKGSEEHPNKASKHIHKWTYSRVHSSATEIQQEQIRVSAHTTKADRRSSPKGLVSASSAPVTSRPKTRNRGRRRGRGEQYDARFLEG